VINYITKKASLFGEANKKRLPIAKALAYCTMLVITAVKNLRYKLTGLYYKHVMIQMMTLATSVSEASSVLMTLELSFTIVIGL